MNKMRTFSSQLSQTTMRETAYQMLFESILEFKDTAVHIESKIEDFGLSCDHNEAVPRTGGRKSRDMWVAMKTVSHFNLGMALELLLKLLSLLATSEPSIPPGHRLTDLYDGLEENTQKLLQHYYGSALSHAPDEYQLIALRNTASDEKGDAFSNERNLNNIREAFEYFDMDAKLYLKRYSYELVEKQEWRHYISDISVFVEFIRDVMDDIKQAELGFLPPD